MPFLWNERVQQLNENMFGTQFILCINECASVSIIKVFGQGTECEKQSKAKEMKQQRCKQYAIFVEFIIPDNV